MRDVLVAQKIDRISPLTASLQKLFGQTEEIGFVAEATIARLEGVSNVSSRCWPAQSDIDDITRSGVTAEVMRLRAEKRW
ncbi:hypothetical protein [Dietzia timorensis]|uniref:Uncharacterized protein n=1 Tax=Dietzia timorensis TaxID=499555 RepID=A0A173LNP8_9ACTN|nr:hypothetical protein [Dietzia timorensis]ANI92332.1 Hypothetical protein BJL86_1555 [Dietzia timorensis]